MGIDELLKSKKVIVCCGSGGVGKTTMSAALGVRAAELGLKVLVLTIDPARRLANSLGLTELDDSERIVPGQAFTGELHAAMLDTKKTFDNFILGLAPNAEAADRVLRNPIYRQLSTALGGSQEFTSLEKLYTSHSSGKYDLVILDTPPTAHAIDFLAAPQKIYNLFQEGIIKWFMMPINMVGKIGFGIFNTGTRAAMKVFEKLVGSQLLTDFSEFFISIKDWQQALRERTAAIHRLLTSSDVGFLLVTGFSNEKIEEAQYFERTLKKGGFHLSGIIVNRAFPTWLHESQQESKGDVTSEGRLRAFYNDLSDFYAHNNKAFAGFAREHDSRVLFLRIPDFDQDVHDIKALTNLAAVISNPERANSPL